MEQVEQVTYQMIINLDKHRAIDEKKDVQEQAQDVNEALPNNVVDRNVINLGQFKRNNVGRRILYRNVKYGHTDDIIALLREKDSVEDATVILDNQLCLLNGFVIQQSLKNGGFSESVDLCFESVTSRSFIRKTIKKKKFSENEVKHLCQLNSNYISKILGFCIRRDCYEILQEYCGFDLCVAMNMTWKFVIIDQLDNLIIQMAEAISHCNQLNIFHLDIKPQNICIAISETHIQLKLTDFGASKLHDNKYFTNGFTPKYAAPEMHYDACREYLITRNMNAANYKEAIEITQNFCANYHLCSVSEKSDLFSVGLTCVYIKYHEDPIKLLLKMIPFLREQIHMNGCLSKMYSLHPNLMKHLVNDSWGSLSVLISNLLNGDPSMRWSLNNVFIFMKQLMTEKHSEVNASSSSPVVNEVDAVQPDNHEEDMNISPNMPNFDLLL